MGKRDVTLLRNIGIASVVVIAVITLFSIVGNTDGNPCQQAVQEYQKLMEPVCSAEYLERGYDTVEQCMNDEMGSMPDPRECM